MVSPGTRYIAVSYTHLAVKLLKILGIKPPHFHLKRHIPLVPGFQAHQMCIRDSRMAAWPGAPTVVRFSTQVFMLMAS